MNMNTKNNKRKFSEYIEEYTEQLNLKIFKIEVELQKEKTKRLEMELKYEKERTEKLYLYLNNLFNYYNH